MSAGVRFRLPREGAPVPPRLARTLAVLVLGAALVAPIDAQAPPEGSAAPKPAPEAAPAPPAPPPLVLDEEALGHHFRANTTEVTEEGRVKLVYEFTTKEASLLEDWLPKIAETRRRIRWSQGLEGTFSTVEHGLIIADEGTFLHRAKWEPDVELSLDFLSMSGQEKSDVFAAIFLWDKGKQIVGSQVGEQCIRLAKNLAPKGRPVPAQPLAQLSAESRVNFGVRLRDGIVSALRGGSAVATSQGEEGFVKDPAAGQVGLAWKGRVNGFIFRVVIEGRLSPEWVKENIPKAIVVPEATAGSQ